MPNQTEKSQHIKPQTDTPSQLDVKSTAAQAATGTMSQVDTSDLPVLAKDSYYLGRLERELARAAVTKNKAANSNAHKNDSPKAADILSKKRAQYEKIKTRSQ